MFDCLDCGLDTSEGEYYAVEDDVWLQSGLDLDGGMLCVGCLETRLGRTLVGADFKDAPIHWLSVQSPRLQDRLGR